jgi:hypothetical protein
VVEGMCIIIPPLDFVTKNVKKVPNSEFDRLNHNLQGQTVCEEVQGEGGETHGASCNALVVVTELIFELHSRRFRIRAASGESGRHSEFSQALDSTICPRTCRNDCLQVMITICPRTCRNDCLFTILESVS